MVHGHNFDLIPDTSIATLSSLNYNPGMYRDSDVASAIADIITKDNTVIVFKVREVVSHSTPRYLGMIVSADRGTVYWVNETNPLP